MTQRMFIVVFTCGIVIKYYYQQYVQGLIRPDHSNPLSLLEHQLSYWKKLELLLTVQLKKPNEVLCKYTCPLVINI